ncbi:DUF2218 domain-containing protein [Marinobacter sp. CA1]|uniref:DUF2218 domain-containing protein n=1 Tax=Marinobacter sp. CA1 TaxID=2817656 RepID=UPI001D07E8F9|nr:DUF2218 domain-containing protein [Marinobacter sp. CA1]MCG8517532.1 DUF2218 domain-containing protein [Pseudomonadales bacterium]UDL05618.1 DUF2218 domain-containing protein [Marinobacter sp. CA1]
MPAKHALVATADASRYLKRLCRHFSHKVDVTWDDHQGDVAFAMGQCRLEARDEGLSIHCQAGDEAALEQVGQIVAVHLEGFARNETLTVVWTAA